MPWHDPVGRLSDPTPEEFAKWLTPEEAFGHLSGGVNSILSNALLGRLKSAELFAAASTAKWTEHGSLRTLSRVSIDPSWWANVEGGHKHHYDALWAHGDIALGVPDRDEDTNAWVSFFGVKFEFSTLRKIVPTPVNTISRAPRPPLLIERASGPRDPEPETGDGDNITTEEYERWISVAATVALFAENKLAIGLFGPRLMKRLFDGEIVAVADTHTRRRGSEKEVLLHRIIRPGLWEHAAPDNAFWRLNEIDLRVPSRSPGPDTYYTLRGIKFRPRDILRMLGRDVQQGRNAVNGEPIHRPLSDHERLELIAASATRATYVAGIERPGEHVVSDTKVNDVSTVEIDAWYRALSSRDQALGLVKLWAKARADHRPRKVVRKQIETFVNGRKTGRKPVER